MKKIILEITIPNDYPFDEDSIKELVRMELNVPQEGGGGYSVDVKEIRPAASEWHPASEKPKRLGESVLILSSKLWCKGEYRWPNSMTNSWAYINLPEEKNGNQNV